MNRLNDTTPADAGECGRLPEALQVDRAFSMVVDMEDDICDLRRVASLLSYISEAPSQIDPSALRPITGLLYEMGDRLHEKFVGAFDALGGQS